MSIQKNQGAKFLSQRITLEVFDPNSKKLI